MGADSRSADNKITRPPNPMGSGHVTLQDVLEVEEIIVPVAK